MAKRAAKKSVKRATKKTASGHPADRMTMEQLRAIVTEYDVLKGAKQLIKNAYDALFGMQAPAAVKARKGGKGAVRPKSVITRARKANKGISDAELLKVTTVKAWMKKNGYSAAQMKQAIADYPAA